MLIYTNRDLYQHWKHVQIVLNKLEKAGLYLDIKKYKFECKETKYLGFIIQAGKGIKIDPEKVKAIKE
jgi:ribosome-interacting GTPase 1